MTSDIPQLSGPEKTPRSGNKPKQLVIFLHGLGADGNDLISLADFFAEALPDAQFTSPHAPFPCDIAPMGRQWFSLLDRTESSMLAGAREAEPVLNAYIDDQLKQYGLKDNQLALVGFSQGTMMAMHTALRRTKPCAAILGYSGALVGNDTLGGEIKSRPPICLIHGNFDMVVPFGAMDRAAEILGKADVPVETHARPGLGHGIDPDGMRIGIEFLARELAKQSSKAA